MTAKQYLKQLPALDRRVKTTLEELHCLKVLITSAHTTGYDAGTRNAERIDRSVARLVSLENAASAEIDCYVDLREQLRDEIDALPTADYREILRYRYLCGLTWEQIAVKLSYSYRGVLYLHGRALREFESVHTIAHLAELK